MTHPENKKCSIERYTDSGKCQKRMPPKPAKKSVNPPKKSLTPQSTSKCSVPYPGKKNLLKAFVSLSWTPTENDILNEI